MFMALFLSAFGLSGSIAYRIILVMRRDILRAFFLSVG